MINELFKNSESLTIQELETRQELTVAMPSTGVEVAKQDNNDTTIDRCNGNSGS